VFDDERAEPQQGRRDTELTLSSTTLFGILFGLLLLCGLCFGVGYALGHRGAAETAAAVQPDATTPATLQSDGSRPKPSAGPASAAQPASNDVADPAASADTAANSADGAPASNSAAGQAPVRTALPAGANAPQPAEPEIVRPAIGPGAAGAGALMVQIAAVTSPEDADVLMSALRKRGYAVAARRDAVDGLIHVRIGPFGSRDEANSWRQRLLNDGYNAIVQP